MYVCLLHSSLTSIVSEKLYVANLAVPSNTASSSASERLTRPNAVVRLLSDPEEEEVKW